MTQSRVSESLNIPMSKIRVIAPNVGGGFGGKIETNVQPICVALAMKTMRPVKIVLTREEEFVAMHPRHPAILRARLGLKKDGRFVAKETVSIFDTGAYSDDGPGVAGFGALMSRGPYRIPHLRLEGCCVYTNKVRAGAFRGFGNPQCSFASESLIDIAAKELGIDPLEIRLKNAIVPGDHSVGNQILKSVGIKECLEKAAQGIGWGEKKGKYGEKGLRASITRAGSIQSLHW